ncbi:hypothetical protein [Mycobacterium xenopi]|uniref:hypothetical protein n=1 Tax=Mycobacterium xenopi TaxID=1789 RepID=UPI000A15AEC7|nr:hypothetical protein [Mycobacterium xenopi]ORX14134.1 hypothetical protein AWC32_14215 [Mycobacterium xenopi]SPX94863.1 cell wall-associated hydrolase, invasion-associated protein [Mycobacterium xenopi]
MTSNPATHPNRTPQPARPYRSWPARLLAAGQRRSLTAAVHTLTAALAAFLVIVVCPVWHSGPPPCRRPGGPIGNGEALMATGIAMNIPENGIIIGLAAAMGETGLRNLANPNVPASLSAAHDGLTVNAQAVGILQQGPSWGSPSELMSPAVAAGKFFTALRAVNDWQAMPPQQVAGIVARSAFPGASPADVSAARQFYRDHLDAVRAPRCPRAAGQVAAIPIGARA